MADAGNAAFWLVVLVAGGKFWMARALKRVIVQGVEDVSLLEIF